MNLMELVDCLIQYHRDRIFPSCALHFGDVQDLADLYYCTPQQILCAMDIAVNYLNTDDEVSRA